MRGGGGDPLLTSSFPQAVNFGGSREAQDEGFSRGSLYLALHMPGCKPQGLVRGREQRRENVQSGFLGRQGCPIQGLQIGEGPIRIHLSSAPAKALTPAPSRGVRASPPWGGLLSLSCLVGQPANTLRRQLAPPSSNKMAWFAP